MKKFILFMFGLSVFPATMIFAAPLNNNCVLNSVCVLSMYGMFNEIVHTYDIPAKKTYRCEVLNGVGEQFRITNNVQPSPGVTYSKGATLATPFEIHGPDTGKGSITYTVNNRNKKVWQKGTIRYQCKPID